MQILLELLGLEFLHYNESTIEVIMFTSITNKQRDKGLWITEVRVPVWHAVWITEFIRFPHSQKEVNSQVKKETWRDAQLNHKHASSDTLQMKSE